MRVLLLSSTRSPGPALMEGVRRELGSAADGVTFDLVSWRQPSVPLTVDTHLVMSPRARRNEPAWSHRRAVSFPTEAAVPSAVGAAATGDAGGPAEAAPAETAVELEGATAVTPSPDAESVAVPAKVAALAAAPPAPPLPLTPRGLVKRVRRRLRPLRRWVRHHPALRKVRGALALEQHLAFAVACARDEPVRKLAARADIIVGLDTGSYQTLWVLARLVRTPHAVVGLAAARRILKEGS